MSGALVTSSVVITPSTTAIVRQPRRGSEVRSASHSRCGRAGQLAGPAHAAAEVRGRFTRSMCDCIDIESLSPAPSPHKHKIAAFSACVRATDYFKVALFECLYMINNLTNGHQRTMNTKKSLALVSTSALAAGMAQGSVVYSGPLNLQQSYLSDSVPPRRGYDGRWHKRFRLWLRSDVAAETLR